MKDAEYYSVSFRHDSVSGKSRLVDEREEPVAWDVRQGA